MNGLDAIAFEPVQPIPTLSDVAFVALASLLACGALSQDPAPAPGRRSPHPSLAAHGRLDTYHEAVEAGRFLAGCPAGAPWRRPDSTTSGSTTAGTTSRRGS